MPSAARRGSIRITSIGYSERVYGGVFQTFNAKRITVSCGFRYGVIRVHVLQLRIAYTFFRGGMYGMVERA